uniref:Uncharacterized protein n=1 Tax=Abalone asfa-like virus TaxID=2839893 RepID=A0A5K7Y3J8_9VIRU|nr:hypothetical protein [Abalone asfa-like virus]BCY04595.1 hypothetical protein [Abalone asfa-like virus]
MTDVAKTSLVELYDNQKIQKKATIDYIYHLFWPFLLDHIREQFTYHLANLDVTIKQEIGVFIKNFSFYCVSDEIYNKLALIKNKIGVPYYLSLGLKEYFDEVDRTSIVNTYIYSSDSSSQSSLGSTNSSSSSVEDFII